jgi:HAD superfamily hydrolase (TIGR01509 family)
LVLPNFYKQLMASPVAAPVAFLFDMDGVICDNNSFHKESWTQYATLLGATLYDEDIIQKVYGKTNKQILEFVLGRSVSEDELEYHAEAKEALFRSLYGPHFKLTNGLEHFLEQAKAAGIKMGLATNAPESNLNFSWEHGQLGRFFTAKAHPGLVPNPKPAPDLYLYVAQALGVAPTSSIVFEDSKTGIAAAKAAGAKVVAIASTLPAEELAQYADWVVKDFTELTPELCVSLLQQPPVLIS